MNKLVHLSCKSQLSNNLLRNDKEKYNITGQARNSTSLVENFSVDVGIDEIENENSSNDFSEVE